MNALEQLAEAALAVALHDLRKSTDPPRPVPAVLRSPATSLRMQADQIEARDRRIQDLRQALIECGKWQA